MMTRRGCRPGADIGSVSTKSDEASTAASSGCWLGADIGSVTTKMVALDRRGEPLFVAIESHQGNPLESLRTLCARLQDAPSLQDQPVLGLCTTGSGRLLGEVMLGADMARNEITAHARAALHFCPEVQTIIEIGGQDSKIILLRQGYPVDFAMNSACAAGTGSFLEQQARRLQIPLDEFGDWAARAEKAAPLAGRCVVFAETDMIHKQQLGIPKEEIIRGLCHALVRNYLHGVARGKEIAAPILFQGGVAANEAIRHALIEALGHDVVVPPQHQAMGAIGAALLVAEAPPQTSSFRGFDAIAHASFRVEGRLCDGCQEQCEIVRYYAQDQLVASYGNRCEVGTKPDKKPPDMLCSSPPKRGKVLAEKNS